MCGEIFRAKCQEVRWRIDIDIEGIYFTKNTSTFIVKFLCEHIYKLSVYFFLIISFKRNGRALTVPLYRKLLMWKQ